MSQSENNPTPAAPSTVEEQPQALEREISIPEMFQSLYLYKKWIALFTLVCLLGATLLAIFTWLRDKDIERYRCKSSVAVSWRQNADDPDATISDKKAGEYIVSSVRFLIESEALLELVNADTDLSLTRKKLSDALEVEQYEETEMLTLYLTWDGDQQQGLDIMNAVLNNLPALIKDALDNGSINIVDRANTPEQVPITPNFRMVLLVTLVGLVIGCGGAIVLGIFRGTIQSRSNITTHLNLETVGEIPRVHPDSIYLYGEIPPTFKYREAYRTFLSILRHRMLTERIQSLYITSTMAHEGKSSLLLNIARSFAEQEGYKVLLVDYDTRKPQMARTLRIKHLGRTIHNVIDNKIALKDAIVPVSDNFHVLCADTTGFKILNDETVEQLNALRSEYDFIFYDTPPIGIVSDALRLNGCTDACLYAVRHNYVTTDIIRKGLHIIRQSEHPILGCVLNEVRSNPLSQYYYESHYRHYGYYTYDNAASESEGTDSPRKPLRRRTH